jgi:hypothetical protein
VLRQRISSRIASLCFFMVPPKLHLGVNDSLALC